MKKKIDGFDVIIRCKIIVLAPGRGVKFGMLCFGGPGPVTRHGHTILISSHAVTVTCIEIRGRLTTNVISVNLSQQKKQKTKKTKSQ